MLYLDLEYSIIEPFPGLFQSVMSTNTWKFESNGPQILFVYVFVPFSEYKYTRIIV